MKKKIITIASIFIVAFGLGAGTMYVMPDEKKNPIKTIKTAVDPLTADDVIKEFKNKGLPITNPKNVTSQYQQDGIVDVVDTNEVIIFICKNKEATKNVSYNTKDNVKLDFESGPIKIFVKTDKKTINDLPSEEYNKLNIYYNAIQKVHIEKSS